MRCRLSCLSERSIDSFCSPFGPALGCYCATLCFLVTVLLRRHAPKGQPWPAGAFSASCLGFGILRRSNSCIPAVVETRYATPPIGLIMGRLGVHRIFRRAYSPKAVRRQQVCALNGGLSLRSEAALHQITMLQAGTD